MALAVNGLERAFTFEKGNETITLSDPNPSMTPEQVMNFYAGTYAELTTATVRARRSGATEAFIRSKRHSARKDDGYEKENDNR